jgi:D-alanyl-D-alanine carboxypeptidase
VEPALVERYISRGGPWLVPSAPNKRSWFDGGQLRICGWGDRVGRVLEFIRTCIAGVIVVGLLLFVGAAILTSPSKRAASPTIQTIANRLPAPRHDLALLSSLSCLGPASFMAAASQNRETLNASVFAPFGVPEAGWAIYAPLIAREIGTTCGPDSVGFAAAFSRWQTAHNLSGAGRVDAPALSLLATTWLLRRPFVRAMKIGCPPPPSAESLATASPAESFGGKVIQARPAVLNAYRQMVAAARQEIALPPPLLTIASAYRGPVEEGARCADGSCGNPAKARCSAHRTGLALDLYLGSAPGRQPFSTANEDRLFQSRSPAYGWLVRHADQFGFVPYPFEPWHWEWTGESV